MNLKTLLTCAAAVLWGSPVYAMPYVADNPADILFDASHPFFSGTFDLTTDGYNPATDAITLAIASFLLVDAGTGATWEPGVGLEYLDMTSDPGVHYEYSGLYRGFFTVGTSDRMADLSQDGRISYTITWEFGQFWVNDAKLQAYTTARVADTASSAGLIALAMIALHLFRLACPRSAGTTE